MRSQLCGIALLAALPAAARNDEPVQSRDMFDQHGQPNAFANQFTDDNHMPRLREGAPFRFPDRMKFEHVPGCVTVEFLITPEGKTDKYVIVDSQPKGAYDEAVVEALKFWVFDTNKLTGWLPMRQGFYFEAEIGSHIGATSKDCAVPRVAISSSIADAAERVTPYYPPPLAQAVVAGCATIAFTVNKEGLADEFEVVDFAPEIGKPFAQAALQALTRWDKLPASSERQYVSYAFSLKGKSPATRECKIPGGKSAPLPRPSGKY